MGDKFRKLKNYLRPGNDSLAIIAQLESSNGKFRNHPVVNSGIQRGTRAISSYGLMPNTVYEMAQKYKPFRDSPLGKQILQTQGNPEAINQITADSMNDDEAANALWQYQQAHLAKVIPQDKLEEASVYAHRRGVSGALNHFKEGRPFDEDPYVQSYKQKKASRFDPSAYAKEDVPVSSNETFDPSNYLAENDTE